MAPLLALSWIVLSSQEPASDAGSRARFDLRCLQGEIILDNAGMASGVATLRLDNSSGRIVYWLRPVFSLTNPAGGIAACIEECTLRSGDFVRFDLPLKWVSTPGAEEFWEWQGCFALSQHPESKTDEEWEFVTVDVRLSTSDGLTIAVGAHAPDFVRLGVCTSRLDGLAVEAEFFEHLGCPEIRFTYRNATDADLFWTPDPEGCSFGGSEGPDRWRDRRDEVDGRAFGRSGVGCSPLHVDEAPTAEQIAEWRMAPGAVKKDAWFWDCVHWTAADGLPYVDELSRMIEWGRRFEVARPSTQPPATRGGWKERRAHVRWNLEAGAALSYRWF